MAGHPIFVDPPSRDMTAAAERQRELDAKIEQFLAGGGQIQAFDRCRRPVEATPWAAFQVNPKKAIARPQPAPVTPAPAPRPAAVTQPAVAARHIPGAVAVPAPLEPMVPPAVDTSDVEQALRDIRKQAAAIKRRLDRLSCELRAE